METWWLNLVVGLLLCLGTATFFMIKIKKLRKEFEQNLRKQKKAVSEPGKYLKARAMFEKKYVNLRVEEIEERTGEMLKQKKKIEVEIKELKKNNIELEKLSLVATKTDNYVIISDKEDKIEWVNNGFTRLTGYYLDEVIGKKPAEILRGELTDKTNAKILDEKINLKKPYTAEILNYNKMGEPIWMFLSVTPLINEGGEVTRYITLGSDITESKKAEETLIISESHYRSMFEQLGDSLFIYDKKTHQFLDCNEAAVQAYGYRKEEMKQMGPLDLHPPEELELVKDNIGVESPELPNIYTHVTKNGERKMVEIRSKEIEYYGNPALLSVVRDVTERKNAEEAIKKQKEQIEEKNKKLWKTSLLINKQKEEVEKLNIDIKAQKEKLEETYQDISEKNKRLWKTSLLVNKQKEEVEIVREQLAEKNKHVTDSIRYAQIIQRAIMPPISDIKKALPESFIFFQPKDIVSGDFYWFTKVDNKVIIAAVDCTGHGVPGAFMSMIGNATLNNIVLERKITEPAKILEKLQSGIRFTLRQHRKESEARDGMDVAICCLTPVSGNSQSDSGFDGGLLQFAGANNPLYFVNNQSEPTLSQFKGEQGISFENISEFTNHEIKIKKRDTFYIFSDGYADQFGGSEMKKFKYKRLRNLLISIQDKPMNQQEKIISKTFENWKGNHEQIDDVLIIGVRI